MAVTGLHPPFVLPHELFKNCRPKPKEVQPSNFHPPHQQPSNPKYMAATRPPPPFMLSHELLKYVKPKSRAFRISDFDKISELGAGGCGTVTMVRHRSTSKLYALKTGLKSDGQTAIEAKILRHCTESPYIVRCHSVLRTASGDIALLLERMNAGSLDRILYNGRRCFSELSVAHVAAQALAGLAFMHQHHIVHLDVKPDNILADTNGTVKICDLGFAKMVGRHSGVRRSFSAGTTAYFSPERFSVDPYANCDAYAADIWSLGITLMELFMGRCPTLKPGHHSSGDKLINRICFEPPPSLPRGAASKELCRFLDSCLQKDPKKRPTALELLEHPFIAKRPKALSRDAFCELIRQSNCRKPRKLCGEKKCHPRTPLVERSKLRPPGFERMPLVWYPVQHAIRA